ncbi:MAG: histidine phosphatase family protein [Pseudomonadota bacterium]
MRDLLILRHGETVWNREGRLQGSLDAPLTARGRVQAARQGAILRRLGGTWPVLCSPQGRAVATAALAGLRPELDPALREIELGRLEGTVADGFDLAPGLRWKFDAPGGEGQAAFLSRIDGFLARCPARAILVTHGVVCIGLRGRLAGLPVADWDGLRDWQGVVYRVGDHDEAVLS